MKIYITCPFSHSQERVDLMCEVESFVRKQGFDTFKTIIGGTPEEIFKRDYEQLESSDILLAEVSETSHGVGMEIGLSYEMGSKRILILENGRYITKFAQGMPETTIIEYKSLKDLKPSLKKVLDKLK